MLGGGFAEGAAPCEEIQQPVAGRRVHLDDALQEPERLLGGITVFSLPVVGTMVCHQTSVGVFPRAAFSAPTSAGAMLGMRSISSKLKV